MGASGWDFYVPYQEDLATALEQLRQRVFAEGRRRQARIRSSTCSLSSVPMTGRNR